MRHVEVVDEDQRLLTQLGVASQSSDMSFGVADPVGDFEYSGASPNALRAARGRRRATAVTLNRDADVRREHVLGRFRYEHPIFTAEGVAAQRRWHDLDAVAPRTSYCGAYWGWGFHEDGVVSALRACAKLGGRPL